MGIGYGGAAPRYGGATVCIARWLFRLLNNWAARVMAVLKRCYGLLVAIKYNSAGEAFILVAPESWRVIFYV